MPEMVVKLMSSDPEPDAMTLMKNYASIANGRINGQEIRLVGTDEAEGRALGGLMNILSHVLGHNDIVTVHVCSHDIGIGDCLSETING